MKSHLTLGASILFMAALYFAANAYFSGRWQTPDYARVRIVEREVQSNGKERLNVQLSPDVIVELLVPEDETLHASATFVCAGIHGDRNSSTATAVYSDLSNCPLPISRTMPQSGVIKQRRTSDGKTIRSMSFSGTSGTPAGQFPKSNMGFNTSR